MEGTRNNLTLLLAAQLVEVDRIAGNTNGQVRVLLRMLVSRHQGFTIEHVYVQVMRVLREVAPLGSGLGGLNWNIVKERIEKSLVSLNDVQTNQLQQTR